MDEIEVDNNSTLNISEKEKLREVTDGAHIGISQGSSL